MPAPTFRQTTSQRRVPGAGSETLRKIGRAWSIVNIAEAIPYDLHPIREHCANEWSRMFQAALEVVSRNCRSSEIDELKEFCQRVVDTRRYKNQENAIG